MSITIAGKPILVDWQGQLRKFLGDRLPPENILFARHPSEILPANPFTCDNAADYVDSPYPPLPPVQIGEVQWPSGASRYARALYCVDWTTLAAIAADAWGYVPPETQPSDVPASWGTEFYEVELKIEGEEIFTAGMYALRPYRVTGTGTDLWLLPLVDKRWLMAHKAHQPSETPPEDVAALFTSLAASAGTTISTSTIPIAGDPDPRIWQAEQPAVKLLDALALSVGLRIVREPGGAMKASSAAASDTIRAATIDPDWQILSGGIRGVTELPSSVKVHCRKPGGDCEAISAAIPGGNTVGGTAIDVWSSWLLTASNAAATSTFAGQIASVIAAWKTGGGQYSTAGPLNYTPSGYDDFASIVLIESEDGEYLYQTRVRELPGVFLPRAILLGGQEDECERHFLFTLSDDMTSAGQTAVIRTMDDLDEVDPAAYVVNTLGQFSHLLSGQRGVCVRVGGAYYAIHPDNGTSSGATVTKGVVFTLTSSLTAGHGNTATANVLRSGESGVSIGDPITVHSTGDFQGLIGCEGLAIKIDGQYWVAHVNQYATLSEATLSDDTHNFSGGATRNGKVADQRTIAVSSLDAISRYPHSFLPSPDPTIHNPHNLLGLSGDKTIVAYNQTSGQFELIEVLPANKRRLRFKLTANQPAAIVSTTDFSIVETREFTAGEVTAPTTLYDDMGLVVRGQIGDTGSAEYSYADENWKVVQFQHKPEQHFLFTLAATMGPGGASASIRSMDDATAITTANVVNTLGQFDHLGIGERGLCVRVDGIYYAIHPEDASSAGTANGATFTLSSSLAGSHGATATATVIATNVPGVTTGDTITVVNTGSKKSYLGCTGHAIRIGSEYWISEVQQMSILSKATLTGGTHVYTAPSGWDSFSKYGNTQQTITTSTFEPVYRWPLNFLPTPRPTIHNPHNLVANSGDEILLVYDDTLDQHHIAEVFHQSARGIVFKLMADWPNGLHQSQTTAEAVGTLPGMAGPLPAVGFTLRDRYNRAHNAKAEAGARPPDYGHAVFNYSTREYDIVECSHEATHAFGTLRASFSGMPSTFNVNIASTGYADGKDPTVGIGWLTVQNRYSWESGTIGHNIEIIRDPSNGNWYPVQMRCPA